MKKIYHIAVTAILVLFGIALATGGIQIAIKGKCIPKGILDPNCSPQDKWCKICK